MYLFFLFSDMAIRKMLSTLDDPFTRFLEPEKFKSLRVWLLFFYVNGTRWCQRSLVLKSYDWSLFISLKTFTILFHVVRLFMELHFETFHYFIWRQSGTQGALTGVGLSIGYPTGFDESSTGLVVISSSPGGPANKAGILPGDIILAINELSTEDMDIYDAAEHLQWEFHLALTFAPCLFISLFL